MTMTKLILAMALVLASLSGGASAQDRGPAVETKAPDIGMPSDQTAQPRTLASLMGAKGLVLLFFRSAAW
jgi:hypothetical protein